MLRRVTIAEARALSESKSREYTIHWRPDGNNAPPDDRHYAEVTRHTVKRDPPRDSPLSG